MSKAKQSEVATHDSLGMGGLGSFQTEADFVKSLQEAEAPEQGTATADDIKQGMGNTQPRLEQVKVKHGGACCFQFPDGEKQDEVVGAVIAYTYHNSYFSVSFDEREEGQKPPCFSNDGATVAAQADDPQAKDCGACTRNRDATDRDAREAAFDAKRSDACNNYISLAVALPGREVPVLVKLSNSSFKPWAAYIQSIGTQGRFKIHEVATRLKLVNRTGAGGSEYSICHFEKVAPLPASIAEEFAKQAVNYRGLLRREADRGDTGAGEGAEAAAAVASARAEQSTADAGL